MIYFLIGVILALSIYCVYANIAIRQSLRLCSKLCEDMDKNHKLWLEERRDLYNRLMSRDLADYKHNTTPKKPSTSSNFLKEAKDRAQLQAD